MEDKNSIISANQFDRGQQILLVCMTVVIVFLSILASFLLFKNYQLRKGGTDTNPVEISPSG
ncbi:hypothetical protein ACFL2C_02900 [Patescibacteria group bacterium]